MAVQISTDKDGISGVIADGQVKFDRANGISIAGWSGIREVVEQYGPVDEVTGRLGKVSIETPFFDEQEEKPVESKSTTKSKPKSVSKRPGRKVQQKAKKK